MRIYQDGDISTPFADLALPSTPAATDRFPLLNDVESSFAPYPLADGAGLTIHRVFACSTANPALCR